MTTPSEFAELAKALVTAQQNDSNAKQLAQWAQQQQSVTSPTTPGLASRQYSGGAVANAVPKPPSAAVVKLQKWISESIGEIASAYVETVLLRRALMAKLLNTPKSYPLLAFHGTADVVVVRFAPSGSGSSGPVAVYAIPQSILDELVAEDVAAALDGK